MVAGSSTARETSGADSGGEPGRHADVAGTIPRGISPGGLRLANADTETSKINHLGWRVARLEVRVAVPSPVELWAKGFHWARRTGLWFPHRGAPLAPFGRFGHGDRSF